MSAAALALIGAGLYLSQYPGLVMEYGKCLNGKKRVAKRGVVQLNAMEGLDIAALLKSSNVQAFLACLRRYESETSVKNAEDAYRVVNGGCLLKDLSRHPYKRAWLPDAKALCPRATSTAAGAYQCTFKTWSETAPIMGLKDFSPASQTAAALGRIEARGVLGLVVMGLPIEAAKQLGQEWASLPAHQSQAIWTYPELQAYYLAKGGTLGKAL